MPPINVRFTQGFLEDLQRLMVFLEEVDPALPPVIKGKILESFRQVAIFPQSGRQVENEKELGMRELVIRTGRNGYIARYVADLDAVIVLSIKHQRELWKKM